MTNIKLLSALNYPDPGDVDTLMDWLADGTIEVAGKDSDTIELLRLTAAGRGLLSLSLPTTTA
jgi:hypothetical protein